MRLSRNWVRLPRMASLLSSSGLPIARASDCASTSKSAAVRVSPAAVTHGKLTVRIDAASDFAGVSLLSQITPNVKLNLAFIRTKPR